MLALKFLLWLRIRRVVLLPWKIDDFVDEVGGKNGTADYADYTDFFRSSCFSPDRAKPLSTLRTRPSRCEQPL
jgi:hypothetical protein